MHIVIDETKSLLHVSCVSAKRNVSNTCEKKNSTINLHGLHVMMLIVLDSLVDVTI